MVKQLSRWLVIDDGVLPVCVCLCTHVDRVVPVTPISRLRLDTQLYDFSLPPRPGSRHIGLKTQRRWSDQTIVRTTPTLLGLYSLVCLIVHRLTMPGLLWPRSTTWYSKIQATFSDMLPFVHQAIWVKSISTSLRFAVNR